MRILQVCSATEMGGGEVHVADLTRALVQRGHAVSLAVRPNSPLREALAGVILSWHELSLRNSLDLSSARRMAEIIRDNSIDIVHAHVGRDYLVSALACKRSGRARLVITRHHYLPVKQNAIYRWMLQDVGAVIAVSKSVAAAVAERWTLKPYQMHVVPNWIDADRFQPIDRDAARAMFRIKLPIAVACIGQLNPAKGQEEFLRAAARIARTRSDVEFLIVGSEADKGGFKLHLKNLARELSIADRVNFTGFVHHMPELFAAVDVVVVPSWDEGFSLVALEGLASRRAVVASDVGGIRDIIKDNSTGMLFPARDANALANKLLWVVSDAPFRDRLGTQGQKDVYEKFNREQVIDEIEAVYRDVLEIRD